MTTTTPILGITEVAPTQTSKEATINTAIVILEAAFNAPESHSLSAGNLTLTATDWTQYFYHAFSGHTVARTVTVPNTERQFAAFNNGTAAVTFAISGSSGATYALAAGARAILFADGTDVVAISTVTTGALENIVIAVSDETTALTTGTAKVTFRMPYALTLTKVKLSLSTASSSGAVQVDVKKAGSSIFSTLPQVDASAKTSVGSTVTPVITTTALTDDAEMTIDIDTAGTGAAGLKVTLIGHQ